MYLKTGSSMKRLQNRLLVSHGGYHWQAELKWTRESPEMWGFSGLAEATAAHSQSKVNKN